MRELDGSQGQRTDELMWGTQERKQGRGQVWRKPLFEGSVKEEEEEEPHGSLRRPQRERRETRSVAQRPRGEDEGSAVCRQV